MVVIAIIGILYALASAGLQRNYRVNLKSASRRLVGAVRFTFDQAALTRKIHRIAFDIDKSVYWVEVYTGNTQKKEGAESTRVFSKAPETLSSEQTLPDGVFFSEIAIESSPKPITKGMAYIHFFPQGFVEPSMIQIKLDSDENAVFSLVTSPMTGKVTTYHEAIEPFAKK